MNDHRAQRAPISVPDYTPDDTALVRQDDEAVEVIIDRTADRLLTDLASLRTDVIDVYRDALEPGEDIEVRLKAADSVRRALGADVSEKRKADNAHSAQFNFIVPAESVQRAMRALDKRVIVTRDISDAHIVPDDDSARADSARADDGNAENS